MIPVLEKLRSAVSVPISIDTTKVEVARKALSLGADIINDVSGLQVGGSEMAREVAKYGAGLILMHRRGSSLTMQSKSSSGGILPAHRYNKNHWFKTSDFCYRKQTALLSYVYVKRKRCFSSLKEEKPEHAIYPPSLSFTFC